LRADAARADRAESVRGAAQDWERAGAIDGATRAAIAARFPDDRVRVTPAISVLLFLFSLIAINGAAGLVATLAKGGSEWGFLALLALAFGTGLAVLTEILVGPLRRVQTGIELATSLAALGYLIAFAGWLIVKPGAVEGGAVLAATFGVAAVLLAAAAWRWGYALYAGGAAAALLGAFLFVPGGRLAWIALPLVAGPLLLHGSESPRLPPVHRASCVLALAVALAGLYVAFNLSSYDLALLERFVPDRPQGPFWPVPGVRALAIAGTALVPLGYLVLGLRSRRAVFLLLGVATAAASLITLRYYVHFAPLWVVLTISGVLLIAVALALRRYLDSGLDHERGGFTAEPLFADPDRLRLLEAGAAVLSLSPEARPVHEEPRFTGGGGSFGGGGSSSDF
jgi:hypothetical protein